MQPEQEGSYFVYTIGRQRYGLPVSCVVRVVPAVEVTAIPDAPGRILGVVDFEGTVIPVLNARLILNIPDKETELSDFLVIVTTTTTLMAFFTDDIEGVIAGHGMEPPPAVTLLHASGMIEGILKDEQGMILIQGLQDTEIDLPADREALQRIAQESLLE